MLNQEKIGRQWMEVTLAHEHHAWGERRDHGPNNLGSRLLKRLRQNADSKFERSSARETDLEPVIGEINIVWWVTFPDGQDDVDRFGENLVAIEIKNSDRF